METQEPTFAEIECNERLTGVLPIRVDHKGNRRGGCEAAAKADDAEKDGGHNPVVLFFGAPSKAHETNDGADGNRDRHYKTELLCRVSKPKALSTEADLTGS